MSSGMGCPPRLTVNKQRFFRVEGSVDRSEAAMIRIAAEARAWLWYGGTFVPPMDQADL